MSTLYGYKNKLWKVTHQFSYTGQPESFTLQPGKYLLICNGAMGGIPSTGVDIQRPRGGVSYGVLNLTTEKEFFAVVGGDGGTADISTNTPGAGGYNGGGNGGKAASTSYAPGGGGGGASDIRTSLDDTEYVIDETRYLPSGYTRLSYIEATGSQLSTLNISGVDRTVEMDIEFTDSPSADTMFGYSASGTNFIGVNTSGKFYLSDDKISTTSALERNVLKYTRTSERCTLDINSDELLELSEKVIDLDALVAAGTHNWYNWSYYGGSGDGGTNWGTWQFQPSLPVTPNTEVTFNFTSSTSSSGLINCLQNYASGHYMNATCTYSTGHTWTTDPTWNTSGSKYALDSRCNYIRPECRAGSNNAGVKPYNATIVATGTENDTTAKFNIFGIKTIEESIIPAMTSYTAPSGQVIYSGEFSGRPAWAAFDGVDNKTWDGHSWSENQHIIDGNPDSVYVGYEFGYTMTMTSITIANAGNRVYTALVQIRNNNEWTTIYSNINLPTTYTKATYTFDQEYTGDAIRLCIVGAWSSNVYFSTNSYGNNIMEITVFGYDSSDIQCLSGKLYAIREYDTTVGDIVVCIPCRENTSGAIGMYDVINHVFYQSDTNDPYIAGDEIEDTGTSVRQLTGKSITMLSRLIVAGGGGGAHPNIGAAVYPENVRPYLGIGGGYVGGPIATNQNSVEYEKYASQTNGYAFGYGETAIDTTVATNVGSEGCGGGGGGWFGGYARSTPESSLEYKNANGAGGSGYVLTESSYKPDGYQNDASLWLTDTFMSSGHAESASVIICEETRVIANDDHIIVPPTGETCSFNIPSGQYRMKCYGGIGGINQSLDWVTRGGYAEGVVTIPTGAKLFCNVGGSGIFDSVISDEFCHQLRPEMNFNGGGHPYQYGVFYSWNGKSGGGGTDIRINSNSLYARLIVAGGSGGMGNYTGGVGGGLTGGAASNGYGENPGPGTQTETPSNTYSEQYPTIAGGFGYGGNAFHNMTGTTNIGGGAGGGGWFGGNGSYVVRTDTKGGSGGSGYVLTESSYKPDGYLLGSDYYMTDTVLTSGGNMLHLGETRIEIDAIEVSNVKILCRDESGLKYFNETSNQWELISGDIIPDTFIEYGSSFFATDNGLDDLYQILVYDPDEQYTQIDLTVTPVAQTIMRTDVTTINPVRHLFETDFDPTEYDVNLISEKVTDGNQRTIHTTVTIDQIVDQPVQQPKVYLTQYFSR